MMPSNTCTANFVRRWPMKAIDSRAHIGTALRILAASCITCFLRTTDDKCQLPKDDDKWQ